MRDLLYIYFINSVDYPISGNKKSVKMRPFYGSINLTKKTTRENDLMKNNTTIFDIFQTFLTEEEVNEVCTALNYTDTSRKFKVYDLFEFFIAAAANEYKSYRTGSEKMEKDGLTPVDYSTISKKASSVDFNIAKKLFEILITKCNRPTRRILKLPKDLLAVDSTTITVGKGRLKWAKFKGKKAGIKLHIGLNVNTLLPEKVVESIARKHDGPMGEALINTDCILVEDRAYGKHSRLDMFQDITQLFVIRIKNNVKLNHSRNLKSLKSEDSNVIKDITCILGTNNSKTENRFRVVEFTDYKGKRIKVCTNILNVTPEKIADIYKERWKVETFFRFIKQNLNVKRLLGTSENAVYTQLFIALITYVLLHFTFISTFENLRFVRLTFSQFIVKILDSNLQDEVQVCIDIFLNKIKYKQKFNS